MANDVVGTLGTGNGNIEEVIGLLTLLLLPLGGHGGKQGTEASPFFLSARGEDERLAVICHKAGEMLCSI